MTDFPGRPYGLNRYQKIMDECVASKCEEVSVDERRRKKPLFCALV